MNFLQLLPQLLLACLALIMLGLGLSLTTADFKRLLQHPKAVFLALVLQVVVLPAACYFLIVSLNMPATLAIGMMLLAASPGGVSANLFSHLFGGNVAMNISLTAINTVLSVVSLPLITNWAITHFSAGLSQGAAAVVPLQTGKVLEVIAIVLIPVAIGMWVRSRYLSFCLRLEKPVKIFSAVVLFGFALAAIGKEWDGLLQTATTIGIAVLLFNIINLTVGYGSSLMLGLDKPIATAIAFEIGIHNSTLAMYIALTVLSNYELALPAAVYSVSMYVVAAIFGRLFLVRTAPTPSLQQNR